MASAGGMASTGRATASVQESALAAGGPPPGLVPGPAGGPASSCVPAGGPTSSGGPPQDVPPPVSPPVSCVPRPAGELRVVGRRDASVRVSAPDASVARAHLALADVVDSLTSGVAVAAAAVVSAGVTAAMCVTASRGSATVLHVTARPGADSSDRVVVAHRGVAEVAVRAAYAGVAVALARAAAAGSVVCVRSVMSGTCALGPALVARVLLGVSATARAVGCRAEVAAGACGKVATVVHGVATVERGRVGAASIAGAAGSISDLL